MRGGITQCWLIRSQTAITRLATTLWNVSCGWIWHFWISARKLCTEFHPYGVWLHPKDLHAFVFLSKKTQDISHGNSMPRLLNIGKFNQQHTSYIRDAADDDNDCFDGWDSNVLF